MRDETKDTSVCLDARFQSPYIITYGDGEDRGKDRLMQRPWFAVTRVDCEMEPDEDDPDGWVSTSLELSIGHAESPRLRIELQPGDAGRLAGMLMAHVTAMQLEAHRRLVAARERERAAQSKAEAEGTS
jgi:hypothetical protein